MARARGRQEKRQGRLNGHLGLKETERRCRPEPDARRLLEHALERFGLSARAFHRVLRVARTLADLGVPPNGVILLRPYDMDHPAPFNG